MSKDKDELYFILILIIVYISGPIYLSVVANYMKEILDEKRIETLIVYAHIARGSGLLAYDETENLYSLGIREMEILDLKFKDLNLHSLREDFISENKGLMV